MSHKIAIVWRGDAVSRAAATPQNNRYHQIISELAAFGIEAEPAVYGEEMHDEVRAQLLKVDGVLVWVNPLEGDRSREKLDPMLREVVAAGRFVSAHPDTILKMGTKEILYRTRHLGWGTETLLYRTVEELRDGLLAGVRSGGPRVVKQNRGNAGQGVWKVEWLDQIANAGPIVRVPEARRGSAPETLWLEEVISRCEAYFGWGGCIIDQPFQARLSDGMIRCYMGADKVVGFGLQKIKALIPPPPEGPDALPAQPGPRNAWARLSAVAAAACENGGGVDAADDESHRHREKFASHNLGRRLSVWTQERCGRGHLCALRNQRKQCFRDSR
jgi:hypothetical protein